MANKAFTTTNLPATDVKSSDFTTLLPNTIPSPSNDRITAYHPLYLMTISSFLAIALRHNTPPPTPHSNANPNFLPTYNLLPTHFGFLLSTKLFTPSRIFSPPSICEYHFVSTSFVPSSTPTPSHPSLTPSLVTMTESGLFASIWRAIERASSSRLSGATMRFTRPHSLASGAESCGFEGSVSVVG